MAESDAGVSIPVPEGIDAAATRLGGHAWIEGRLFALLGPRAARPVDPGVAARLAVQSRHHGWRAQGWRELIPATVDHDPEAFVAPPDAETDRLLSALAGAPTPVDLLAATVHVVLPVVVDRYETHLDAASPVSDGPALRWLRLVLADTELDRVEALALLARVEPGTGRELPFVATVAAVAPRPAPTPVDN